MALDLEVWAKRIAYVTAITGAVFGALRAGRVVVTRVRYYFGLFRSMIETQEVLLANGGAKKVVEALAKLQPEMQSMLAELRHRQILNEQRWRASHDDDPRAMFEADATGAWIWANRTLLELIDARDFDDVVGSGWVSCASESWRERVRLEWERVVKAQASFDHTAEFSHTRRGRVLVRITACVMRGPEGAMGWSGLVDRLETAEAR